ncbi:MAG: SDR family oxidoreductase [Eubacteriales bacterium]
MNIVIIGGSRGIGYAAARQLAKDGHRLLLVGRSQETLDKAKNGLPQMTETLCADVTDAADAERLFTYCEERFEPDGLILNAAAFANRDTHRSVLKPTSDELGAILDANVVAHYRIVRRLFPLLQKSGQGRIVFIGSTAGIRHDSGGIYGISKWALRSFAYNLREEAKQYGVGVSLINPGGTFTERRVKQDADDTHLLETSDLGIVIATVFRLSAQAVIEQLDIRPLAGDTY